MSWEMSWELGKGTFFMLGNFMQRRRHRKTWKLLVGKLQRPSLPTAKNKSQTVNNGPTQLILNRQIKIEDNIYYDDIKYSFTLII